MALLAAALHRTVMDSHLTISQEGYAQAASLLHRKEKISAARVIKGMQQLSNAFLVLQAGARGYLARTHAHRAIPPSPPVAHLRVSGGFIQPEATTSRC